VNWSEVTADAWVSAAHARAWLNQGSAERSGRRCEHQVLGKEDIQGSMPQIRTKRSVQQRIRVGREQRRWATAERKKESGEVGRLGQNKLEKEEWPRVDIKNRNPFIFFKFF
jgi:hypothetical protein